MKDYVNVRIPGGENYLDLYDRVVDSFLSIAASENACCHYHSWRW